MNVYTRLVGSAQMLQPQLINSQVTSKLDSFNAVLIDRPTPL